MKNILILVLVFMFSGCASIIDGKEQPIRLIPTTNKEVAATVVLPDQEQNVTLPATIYAKRTKEGIVVKIKDDACHKESSQTISSGINPRIWLNFVEGIGCVVGFIVDFSTGAAWRYDKTEMIYVDEKPSCKS